MLGGIVAHKKAFFRLGKKFIAPTVQCYKHAEVFAEVAGMPELPLLASDINAFFTGGKEFSLKIKQ